MNEHQNAAVARAMTGNASDPFLRLLRKEALWHFTACAGAWLLLVASRYAGLHVAGPDAILLTPSPPGLFGDFLSAVLILTFLRVLYGIPLWFVRPPLRRLGTWVLFTLVFGGLFTLRTQLALGMRVEPSGVRIFYSYPASSVVIPASEFSPPRLRQTSVVSSVEIPDTSVRFVPAFKFDTTGQARLRSLYHALTAAAPVGHEIPAETTWK